MVAVLQPLTPEEWQKATGSSLVDGETGMLLARPKTSYAPPADDILVYRKGYRFAHMTRATRTKAETLEANAAQIVRLLEHDLAAGRRHTQNSLQALDLGMSRADIRDAVHTLLARNRIEQRELPNAPARGSRTYLHPLAAPN
jgi:RecA-family ATPase